MDPWYKIATPCKELGEERISRIKAEQARGPDFLRLANNLSALYPEDSEEKRLTRALREHAGMVLRRLAGEAANTTPVMMLITQFGSGKTRTLVEIWGKNV